MLGQSKIQKFGVTTAGHKNIRRFDVAMDNVSSVRRFKTIGDLAKPDRETFRAAADVQLS